MALVKHNFLQPLEEKDWPDTIGIAFTPLTFNSEILEGILAYPYNARRSQYLNRDKPFFYVDCDMGAQLFLAVGERLGWDMRLVELPKHNFIRWHLSDAVRVNWDWVVGDSIEDSSYPSPFTSADIRLRELYLRSFTASEARAYYVGLIASHAKRPDDAERLFREAVAELPHHPLTLNNFAWLYAITPAYKSKSGLAVAYSLAAWSMRPSYGNFADTVACAFAANGQKALAQSAEEFAIDHPDNQAQREGFQKNLKRITAGDLCK